MYLSGYKKGICTPMFIPALFTIIKLWKQSRCPTLMPGLRKCVFIYSGILLSHKEE
jgi:hypothetical protein